MGENKKIILIVDDDDSTRETYTELFKNNGLKVIEAKDGVEGLDVATSMEGIDVIFTGIVMPRMDGFQLIAALKGNAITANIPIIINSHLGREEDRKKALELGAKDFIIRGYVPPAEVVRRIINSLGEGLEYVLKVDPFEFDGQKLISDLGLSADFLCSNCGTELGIRVKTEAEGKLSARIICPNCKKKY